MGEEYIDRKALIENLIRNKGFYPVAVKNAIKEIPVADVAPVVHGRWIDRDGKTWCNVCDASNKQYKPPYCPHCGAKMDGGSE